MKTALEYFLSGDGRLSRGVCFDIHDNLKDIAGNQGNIASATSAGQSETGAVLTSATAPINASDEASISNSGNTAITNNVLDPGAISAGRDIALSGIAETATAFKEANSTVEDALLQMSTLAQKAQQGEVIGFIKPLGIFAVIAFGLYVVGKVLMGIFAKPKEARA